MKTHEAKQLVLDTFTHAYDEQKFRKFIRNLFHDVQELSEGASTGSYIPDAFNEHIASYKRLAKFDDPEGMSVDVLAVKLRSTSKLDNARTMQRNFIARYLNGSRGGELKDAALVAFYVDDSDDWRFSLVRMDYVLDEEQQKIKKELTPARRYSFLVGTSEGTHTAQQQLYPILQSDTETTLCELEAAFNIETITKEFFEKYKALFLNLRESLDKVVENDLVIKQEFKSKEIDTANFAKRLLGQLVFLYFLQKKGWLGVAKGAPWGSGPKHFLRKLFQGDLVNYDNFFNDVLEPLFYEALATERTDNYYEHFGCKIPFLNGGLFEPIDGYDWVNTDIIIDNTIIKDVFDTFDLYNFTVREDEPLEKEVAVDPEMLGKVFENLLEITDRKSKGAFYTRREIVHYMCQESLINYLDTALNTVQQPIASPKAQQSGLFGNGPALQEPMLKDVYIEKVSKDDIAEFIHMGDIVQEHDAETARKEYETNTYRFKLPESIRKNAILIDEKLAYVKVCDPAVGSGAFPVGMMAEIVRARLSLNPYLGDDARSPYSFKRHALQESIYGVDIDASAVDIAKLRLWLSLVVDEDDFGSIKPLPNLDYKVMVGNSIVGIETTLFNHKLLQKLTELKKQYFNETRQSEKESLKKDINHLIDNALHGEHEFDYKIFFSEVFESQGGFDIVLGNPPYVSYGLRGGQKMTADDKKYLKAKYPGSAEYKISLYAIFMDKAIQIARNGGIQSLIVPDSFLLGRYFSKIRATVLRTNQISEILFLPFNVFVGATVGYSVVYFFIKQKHESKTAMLTARMAKSIGHLECKNFSSFSYQQPYFKTLPYNRFRLFFDSKTMNIINKMESAPNKLRDFLNISSGLIAIKGQKTIVSKEKRSPDWLPGIISGGEFQQYCISEPCHYIHFDKKVIKSGYGNIEYIKEKLFIRQTGDSVICALDDRGLLALNNVHIGCPKEGVSLRYFLAVLNSNLMKFYYHAISLEAGRAMAQIDIETLDMFPIYEISPKSQEQLIDLVNSIKKGCDSKQPSHSRRLGINNAQKKIDQILTDIYGLDQDERDFILSIQIAD